MHWTTGWSTLTGQSEIEIASSYQFILQVLLNFFPSLMAVVVLMVKSPDGSNGRNSFD